MGTRNLRLVLLALLSLFAFSLACSSQTLIRENAFDTMQVADMHIAKDSQNSQTIDNVTVTVEPVPFASDDMITVESSQTTEPVCVACSLGGNKVTITERLVPALGGRPMPIFRVRVQNNTDHVIELARAVIAYIPEGKNPISPQIGIGEIMSAEELQGGFTGGNQEDRARELAALAKGQRMEAVTAKAAAITKAPILGPGVKILPKYPYEGVVMFNFDLLSAGNSGEFQIYDIVTVVNAAGDATKRANFSFKFDIRKGTASSLGILGPRAKAFVSTPVVEE